MRRCNELFTEEMLSWRVISIIPKRISGLSETHIIDVVLLSIQGSNKSIEKDDTILLKCCIYTYSTSSNSYAKSAHE
jgi:hypothetical protein